MRFILIFLACTAVACSDRVTAVVPEARIVTFGDSHVDFGIAGNDVVDVSYISQDMLQLGVRSVHSPHSLAGKLEAASDNTFEVKAVNHGIGGTTSNASFRGDGEPNALAPWHGITRFEAEVLGVGTPEWDAGTGKPRVFAYKPNARDFVYVTIGTMDPTLHLDSSETHRNIRKMVALWKGAGLPAAHFFLSTIPPNVVLNTDYPGTRPKLNAIIKQIGIEDGITVIDLSTKTSNGEEWLPGTTGDGIHVNEATMEWVAQMVVGKMKQLDGVATGKP